MKVYRFALALLARLVLLLGLVFVALLLWRGIVRVFGEVYP
jgi:hypothetical protein